MRYMREYMPENHLTTCVKTPKPPPLPVTSRLMSTAAPVPTSALTPTRQGLPEAAIALAKSYELPDIVRYSANHPPKQSIGFQEDR